MQGDSADEVFLLKGGRIKLTKVIEDGTELMLDVREAVDFVGETMFFEEGRYPVSAVCLEDTLTCGFTRSQFEKLAHQHPAIGLQVNKNPSERLIWSTNHTGTRFEDRLYRILCNAAKGLKAQSPQGFVIQFPMTH